MDQESVNMGNLMRFNGELVSANMTLAEQNRNLQEQIRELEDALVGALCLSLPDEGNGLYYAVYPDFIKMLQFLKGRGRFEIISEEDGIAGRFLPRPPEPVEPTGCEIEPEEREG